jgi:hypothetical protein
VAAGVLRGGKLSAKDGQDLALERFHRRRLPLRIKHVRQVVLSPGQLRVTLGISGGGEEAAIHGHGFANVRLGRGQFSLIL